MALQETSLSVVPCIERPKALTRAVRPQVYMVCCFFFNAVSYGLAIGHSAVLLPQIQSGNSTLVIDEDTGSWIASAYSIIGPIGAFLGGISVDTLGRKKTHIMADLCMVLGWIIITCAHNGNMVLLARIVEGVARSVVATANTVLADEVSDPRYRGLLLCGTYASVTVGIVAISVFGALFDWRTTSGFATALAFISLIMFCFMCESPTWLVKVNQNKKAEKILRRLWGPGNERQAEQELTTLKARLQGEEDTPNGVLRQKIKLFCKPHVLKPFLIMHFFNAIQAFCGFSLFTYYSIDILSKTTKYGVDILDSYYTNIIISSLRSLTLFLSCYLIFSLGRRKLAIISGICSFIPAIIVGFLLLPSEVNNDAVISAKVDAYIVYISIMTYTIGMSLGFSILPAIMVGETQYSKIRGVTCGYIYATNDLILGGVLKLYPWLLVTFGIHGIFFMFGISCAICTVFVYLFVPETRGLTLQQIEDYFRQQNILWVTRRKESSKNGNYNEGKGIDSASTLLM